MIKGSVRDTEASGSFNQDPMRKLRLGREIEPNRDPSLEEEDRARSSLRPIGRARIEEYQQEGAPVRVSVSSIGRGCNQIVTGNLTSLSEQELIDCDNTYNNGCNGGLMDYAFQYIMGNNGLHKEDDYPYLMEEGTCDNKKDVNEVVTIDGYHDVPANDDASLVKALAHQPISVAIEASGRDFQFYSGGVFDGHCGTALDHGVAAVGYGSAKGMDYIIVKNSWGSKWGEKGFIRMKRNTGKPEGTCGINKMASYPTKSK